MWGLQSSDLATLATFNQRGFSRTILQLWFRVPNTPRRAADIPWALAWATLPLVNAVRITLFRQMPESWSGKRLKIAEIASRYCD
jgi:hypothetical protein